MRKSTRRDEQHRRDSRTARTAHDPVELNDEQLAGIAGGLKVYNLMNMIMDVCDGDAACVSDGIDAVT